MTTRSSPAPAARAPDTGLWLTLAATPFCIATLWGLPRFVGLAGAGTDGALLAGAGAAAAAFGGWSGSRRLRLAIPLGGAALMVALAALPLQGAVGPWPTLAAAAGTLGAWLTDATTPAGPAAWAAAAGLGFTLATPVYAAARADRPGAVTALALLALAVRWEFVDPAAGPAFWPLAAAALLWWAASRLQAARRAAEPRAATPAAGGAALAAGAVAAALAYALPRRIGPANLGRLGTWLDQLPVIGPLERASREGSLTQTNPPVTVAASTTSAATASPASTTAAAPSPGFSLSQTGFATNVSRLGGPVHPSRSVAMRLTATSGSALPASLYLRGTVRDAYTGRGWRATPAGRATDPAWPSQSAAAVGRAFVRGLALPAPYRTVRLQIRPEAALGATVFNALLPLQASVPLTWNRLGSARRLGAAPPPTLYHETVALPASDAFTGTALAAYRRLNTPAAALLGPLGAYVLATRGVPVAAVRRTPAPTAGPAPLASEVQLPAELPPAVAALARRWTGGLRDPLLQALALREHLLRYPYSLRAPAPPPGQDFVSFFLFDARRGYCTYYASAMAVLLRTIGIASRWVEGFRVPLPPGGGTVAVTNAEAHAWVEAYIPGHGWLTFDPTPGTAASIPDARTRASAARRTHLPSWWLAALPAAGLAALLGAATLRRRTERPRDADPLAQGETIWRTCERVGGRYGRRRARGETPQEYALAVGERLPGWRPAGLRLAQAYARLRWGPPDGAAAALEAMRAAWVDAQAAWRAAAPRSYLWRRWL